MNVNIEFYASLMKYLPPGKSRFRRAVKVDDGGLRGLHALVIGLCDRLGLFESDAERDALARWRDPVLRNHAGLEVGRIDAVLP